MAKTAIVNVFVFDGYVLSGPTTVVLDGGLISATTDFRDANQVDGTGCTLLPGLFDCHVHADKEESLRSFLTYGITTVLDMATMHDISSLRAKAKIQGSGLPGYRSAGPCAAHPESLHATMFGIADELLVKGVADAEDFVTRRFAEGADFLKIIADVPGFDEPTLAALAKAARARGMLSVAHAAMKVAYERATRAGVDVVTHIPLDALLDDETVLRLKADGRVCVPTLAMMQHHTPMIKARRGDHITFDTALANTRKIHAAGIPICAGTDANDSPMMAMPYGSSLHQELELLVECGMSNTSVLQAATSQAAKCFAFYDRGEIKAGLRADLVLVEGNPVETISATRNVRRVWIGGVEVAL